MSDDFPADVRDFIGQHIESIAQLEVLLLLRREPTRLCTADDVAKALYISPQMSLSLLTDLTRRGFVASEQAAYRYRVVDDRTDQMIGRLAQIYQDRRVAVTALIHSQPVSKAFADAFRLRKEK